MFRELAIQFAGQHLDVPPDIFLPLCCWNTASATAYDSTASVESPSFKPEKLSQPASAHEILLAKTASSFVNASLFIPLKVSAWQVQGFKYFSSTSS